MMAAYVGFDPKKDLTLVADPDVKPLQLFVQGKLDAYLFGSRPRASRSNCFAKPVR
jgi:NitT/TauT family transport system substrate-binding protein